MPVPAAHRRGRADGFLLGWHMIDKWLTRCEVVLVGLAVLSAITMMLLTTADAMGRYLFNAPIVGAYELTEKYLMVAMIFFGLSYAFRGGVFIRVTFLVDRLPPPLKLATDHLAHLVSLAFCLVTLYATGGAALLALSDDTSLRPCRSRSGRPTVSCRSGFSRSPSRSSWTCLASRLARRCCSGTRRRTHEAHYTNGHFLMTTWLPLVVLLLALVSGCRLRSRSPAAACSASISLRTISAR